VWLQEESGDVVLRDTDGTEHARFGSVEAVFADPNPYPSGGERGVKRPVIPEALLDGVDAEPSEEIVTVPEGADSLAELSLVVDVDLTVPADSVGGDPVPTDDLDVPDNAARLLEALRDEGESPVTVSDAAAHVDVSDRSVRNYLNALADEGALRREAGDHAADPDKFHLG
jgi:DNA-binding transcriptional ArsR family regulator